MSAISRRPIEDILRDYELAFSTLSSLRQQQKRDRYKSVVTEAEVRVHQLLYLLRRFRDLMMLAERPGGLHLPEIGKWGLERYDMGAGHVLELHGEAFYYFAWRAKCVIQLLPWPGSKGFDPDGVRIVRNQLIEHADKTGGVMARNFVVNNIYGLVLKPWGHVIPSHRPSRRNERPRDKGLYQNADEFVGDLLKLLAGTGHLRREGEAV